jgi:hypothetical protein
VGGHVGGRLAGDSLQSDTYLEHSPHVSAASSKCSSSSPECLVVRPLIVTRLIFLPSYQLDRHFRG